MRIGDLAFLVVGLSIWIIVEGMEIMRGGENVREYLIWLCGLRDVPASSAIMTFLDLTES